MWYRPSLPLSAVTLTSLVLAASIFAQQVPNPVLPGPSGTGDGLTRDALDATPAATPAATNTPAPTRTASARRAPRRSATASTNTRKKANYATISRHRRQRRGKKRDATMIASTSTAPSKKRSTISQRAPLVSFIFWWNGWVVRTFHTRSGTVLLDTIGAKS